MTALLVALVYALVYAPIVLWPRELARETPHDHEVLVPHGHAAWVGETVRPGEVFRPRYVPPDAVEVVG